MGGLLSPRLPRLDGQGVEVERHRHRRALEIGIHEDEEVRASAVWTLFSENTTIGNCPPAHHLSIPAADHDSTSIDPVSADDVWAKLEQAVAQRYNCALPRIAGFGGPPPPCMSSDDWDWPADVLSGSVWKPGDRDGTIHQLCRDRERG